MPPPPPAAPPLDPPPDPPPDCAKLPATLKARAATAAVPNKP
jgi:hypothetical protein